jgi:hypothetical protein
MRIIKRILCCINEYVLAVKRDAFIARLSVQDIRIFRPLQGSAPIKQAYRRMYIRHQGTGDTFIWHVAYTNTLGHYKPFALDNAKIKAFNRIARRMVR